MRDALREGGDKDMCDFISYKEAIARGLTTAHKVGSFVDWYTLQSNLTFFTLNRGALVTRKCGFARRKTRKQWGRTPLRTETLIR